MTVPDKRINAACYGKQLSLVIVLEGFVLHISYGLTYGFSRFLPPLSL